MERSILKIRVNKKLTFVDISADHLGSLVGQMQVSFTSQSATFTARQPEMLH